jgi:hypothetical protein
MAARRPIEECPLTIRFGTERRLGANCVRHASETNRTSADVHVSPGVRFYGIAPMGANNGGGLVAAP